MNEEQIFHLCVYFFCNIAPCFAYIDLLFHNMALCFTYADLLLHDVTQCYAYVYHCDDLQMCVNLCGIGNLCLICFFKLTSLVSRSGKLTLCIISLAIC